MTSKAEKARRQRITAAMRLIEHQQKPAGQNDKEPRPQGKVRYMVQPKEVAVVVVSG